MSSSVFGKLAELAGTTEPALKLLISILIGYPLAIIYRKHVSQHSKLINHLYMIVCGIAICIFNYGILVYHSLIAVIVSYILVTFLNGTPLIVSSFVFHMAYLLVGYYYTATTTYDITWTMPHCVLILRLIGLAFDVSDGQRPLSELSAENKKSMITKKPNLIEIASFSYFPASFLIGPQISYRRFDSYMNKEFDKYTGYLEAGTKRGLAGIGYLAVNVIGSAFVSDSFIVSNDFVNNHGILGRLLLLGLWGRITLYKYISCWLLTESVAMTFGITFAGIKENGEADWKGCSNIKLLVFENTKRFQHYIDSFNVQTNHWVAEYVYKRLKFLGNRYYSQLGALVFLAVWHGFHSGYYVCFFMEFAVMTFEREMVPVFANSEVVQKFNETTIGKAIVWILLKFYTVVGMGFCLAPLGLLTFDRWWAVYKATWMYGFILWFPWPIYKPILKTLLSSKRKPTTDEKPKSQ